jgi:hypothetical protein
MTPDTLHQYLNAIGYAFFPDVGGKEPTVQASSVATCTITNDGNTPIERLQLGLAWEIVRNNVR